MSGIDRYWVEGLVYELVTDYRPMNVYKASSDELWLGYEGLVLAVL